MPSRVLFRLIVWLYHSVKSSFFHMQAKSPPFPGSGFIISVGIFRAVCFGKTFRPSHEIFFLSAGEQFVFRSPGVQLFQHYYFRFRFGFCSKFAFRLQKWYFVVPCVVLSEATRHLFLLRILTAHLILLYWIRKQVNICSVLFPAVRFAP